MINHPFYQMTSHDKQQKTHDDKQTKQDKNNDIEHHLCTHTPFSPIYITGCFVLQFSLPANTLPSYVTCSCSIVYASMAGHRIHAAFDSLYK